MKAEQAIERVGSGRGGEEPMASNKYIEPHSGLIGSLLFSFFKLPSSYLNPISTGNTGYVKYQSNQDIF